jgi:N-acetylglutamate synthase-like GNAT family acetyltransferase
MLRHIWLNGKNGVSMQISCLADHPEFIETLAPWVWEYWRPIFTADTLQDRVAKFRTHLNRDTLPIAWVAHSGSQVLGTASLRSHDLPGREDLTPWLGGVFVAPQFRSQGIGKALCQTVEHNARQLFHIKTLYLFTLDKQAWYDHFGWEMLEPCVWCGRPGDIMVKRLGA